MNAPLTLASISAARRHGALRAAHVALLAKAQQAEAQVEQLKRQAAAYDAPQLLERVPHWEAIAIASREDAQVICALQAQAEQDAYAERRFGAEVPA